MLAASSQIVGSTAGLLVLGLLMIYSATSVRREGGVAFLERSLAWTALGWAVFALVRRVDYHRWLAGSRFWLLVAFVLLVGVLIPGVGSEVNGARRWYRVELWSFQPSEVIKFALPLYLADFLTRKARLKESFLQGLAPPLMVLGIFFALLMLEPDFGTSVLTGLVGMSLLVIGGVQVRRVGWMAALAVPLLFVAIWSSPYRWQRLTTFLDPWADPQGKGYQAVQSQVALGSGGLVGKGIGAGQQKLHYVPSLYADFILAQVGEETGLLGVTVIFALFALLFHGCWRVAAAAPDAAGAYAVLGILLTFAYQAAINIAVVTGMAPTKGIPLPFVSFGGSSLVLSLAALGVAANVRDQADRAARDAGTS